ncbi:hypothetical protein RISK_003892 [Rhodopirellula islandica]|uniref:Uncharacterized protein n=1 Tax=Rhodopirellula islandica TaxID=595434 RepID=A0A0J1BCR0_RHOIS|nr:hypothetical protein RISK_003892 [Rhodopirellula islandica]
MFLIMQKAGLKKGESVVRRIRMGTLLIRHLRQPSDFPNG